MIFAVFVVGVLAGLALAFLVLSRRSGLDPDHDEWKFQVRRDGRRIQADELADLRRVYDLRQEAFQRHPNRFTQSQLEAVRRLIITVRMANDRGETTSTNLPD